MTMLASLYTAEGIIFAADSQITVVAKKQPSRVRPAQRKVIRVHGVGVGDGLVGFFGLAQVCEEPMFEWLRERLRRWQGGGAEALADFIAEGLTADLTARERREAAGFHIGAFERRGGVTVPVFVFLRNTASFVDGLHTDVGGFHADEQLLADYASSVPLADVRKALRAKAKQEGLPFWLRNGDLRFLGPVSEGIGEAARLIVHQPGYQPPSTLEGWERVARTLIVRPLSNSSTGGADPRPVLGLDRVGKQMLRRRKLGQMRIGLKHPTDQLCPLELSHLGNSERIESGRIRLLDHLYRPAERLLEHPERSPPSRP